MEVLLLHLSPSNSCGNHKVRATVTLLYRFLLVLPIRSHQPLLPSLTETFPASIHPQLAYLQPWYSNGVMVSEALPKPSVLPVSYRHSNVPPARGICSRKNNKIFLLALQTSLVFPYTFTQRTALFHSEYYFRHQLSHTSGFPATL